MTTPATLDLTSNRDYDPASLVAEKLQVVREAQPAWARTPVAERVEILRQALHYFESRRDKIAAEVTRSMGKPLGQSQNELSGFFDRAEFLLGAAEDTLAPEPLPDLPGFHRRIEHLPLGVVFVISAWNYPLMISLNGVLAALLAGNTVLLKHASLTTSIGDHFEAALGNIPAHSGILRHAFANHQTAGELIRRREVDHVIFTGSVDGGRAISRACGESMLDCHLELGGKDAAYVAADADPVAAAQTIVDGCMYNAGQSCCGIERVYVHADLFDSFVAKAKELIAAYQLGDPTDSDTTMGPLADPAAADLMDRQVAEARAGGAEVVLGGHPIIINGATYFEPTLILHPTAEMALMREENFGPLMPVMKVGDDEEALAHINDCDLGLTAALFTTSISRAEYLAAQIEAGTVYLNRCDFLDPALPWTGHKLSGRGSGLSRFSFYGLTKRKAIHFKLPPQ